MKSPDPESFNACAREHLDWLDMRRRSRAHEAARTRWLDDVRQCEQASHSPFADRGHGSRRLDRRPER